MVLGIPALLVFSSRNWNRFGTYALAGIILGVLLYLIYTPPFHFKGQQGIVLSEVFVNTSAVYIPLGALCGLVAASVFWLIARPDKE